MQALRSNIQDRCVRISKYIISTKCTVRAAAIKFNISKSTVYVDITRRIEDIDRSLFEQVSKVLQYNKSIRHIRGGEATKAKFSKIRE